MSTVSYKVLLVEDNETYRKAVRLALEAGNFEVMEAENGKIALELVKTNPPNLIVCDVSMPVMDGKTLLTEIKKNPDLASISIVMLTNYQEEIENTVKLGADEAILKATLTPHQVADVCQKYFNNSVLQTENSQTSPI